jgi:prepilin-type processing-associated H-X9-DG protein
MYTQGNNDRLPYFAWTDGRPGGRAADWWWPTQVFRALGRQSETYVCPTDQNPQGTLVFYRKGVLCMSNVDSPAPGSFLLDITYRGSCDSVEEFSPKPNVTELRARLITSWKRPAVAMLLVEGAKVANDRECYRFKDDLVQLKLAQYDEKYWGRYPHLQSWKRHSNKSNFLFMDGHIDRLHYKAAVKLAERQEHYLD